MKLETFELSRAIVTSGLRGHLMAVQAVDSLDTNAYDTYTWSVPA